MLQTLSLQKAMAGQSKETAEFMMRFAKQTGVNALIFTNEGTWIIPPKMRQAFPEYKKYLMENPSGKMVGTSAITFTQNKPIPMYDEKGEQIGGFEDKAFHGYLTIVDHRTGKTYELHQTFLENSNDPAFRPGIVGVNEEFAKTLGMSLQEAIDKIKDPNTPLDDVAMLQGKLMIPFGYGPLSMNNLNQPIKCMRNAGSSHKMLDSTKTIMAQKLSFIPWI